MWLIEHAVMAARILTRNPCVEISGQLGHVLNSGSLHRGSGHRLNNGTGTVFVMIYFSADLLLSVGNPLP